MDILTTVRARLLRAQKTVAVAESCSGGALSKLLTDRAGSSGYFIVGIVTYSNQAKIRLLGIPAKTLATHGAVSESTALAMARNIRTIARSDFGIGITGIAGPGGGTKVKPVGTVFIAAASKEKTMCKEFHIKGSRARVRTQATLHALALLQQLL